MNPDQIIAALNARHQACPGCRLDLSAEQEPDGSYVWTCPNPTCTEHDGCWPVPGGTLRSITRLSAPPRPLR
jgi:hypothetical protein